MPYNGSGAFSAPAADFPAVASTLIQSAKFNNVINDIATGLSTAITKDGQTVVVANIPLGGFKLTGVGAATARTDAATLATIQEGTGVYVATVAGTADAITLTPSPAITAYVAGQTFRFIASGTNTTNVTVNVSAVGAKALTKNGSVALIAGDIPSGSMVNATYDGTQFVLGAPTYGAITPADNVFRVVGSADATKKLAFEVDGFTTGSTRTLTLPNENLSLASSIGKHIYGLTYANNGADSFDIAAGGAMDATGAYWMQGPALTKNLSTAWAVGTVAGMLDTGAVGNNDYYLWAIARSDTGVVDYLASLSSTAPTMPTNYDFKRLIGFCKRFAGANTSITTYETAGGGLELLWNTPTVDVNLSNTLTTTRRTDTVRVPLNFSVTAILNVVIVDASATNYAIIYCPDQADLLPGAGFVAPNTQVASIPSGQMMSVRTSAAGLIAARCASATMDSYIVSTMGFTWARRN